MQSKLLRGTFILTLGTILSKVIGLIYVIPFYQIVGKHGTQLYSYGYVPYTIFISIATAGVPLAVSKFIAKYNALEEYAVGRKLFKSGLMVMSLTGFAAFLIMYLAAPILAEMSNPGKGQLDDVVTVMRAVSFALILVPFMSLIRGYFQGHQSMGPSAASQVVEQIVRILFTLVGAYVVLKFLSGSMVTAVSVATFAAFVGAIGGLAVLFWYWYKRRPYLDELLEKDKGTVNISLKEIYKEIFIYAAPFVFVGIANPLFQLIDQFTLTKALVEMGTSKKLADTAFGILNFESHKIVIIPVSLATAFSLTLVPSITKAYVENDRKNLTDQLNQTFQVLLFLTLPAAIGLSLLAEPVYTVFYEHDALGTQVLGAYAPVAILFSLYSVTAAIMQGINEQRYTILSLLVGLLVKLSLNIPLVKMFETRGAVLATAIGYSASIIINLIVIKYFSRYQYRFIWRRSLLIVIFAGCMWVGTEVMYRFLSVFLSPASKMQSILIILISAFAGAAIYFYLGLKSGLATRLFGNRIERVLTKFKLPRRRQSVEN
ncbi:cell division protein [Bacillus sp. AFS076308]|uniref:putative polysaccharide biosynthesis protein n=1 Tax=unclassified Bacillus (in: firmicutes) TaxID=185979 RepID=UPI000BF92291|nr:MULTISPECIES: polysaccharide biosynthesis protein [unclassified Bacillus (in: firmicutes)]PFN96442.1 cell division protein [Bacillus sp. AFS076308]PGV48496.1 cell division protein [Bacillus sp. AFS037270]